MFLGQNSVLFSLIDFLSMSPAIGSSLIIEKENTVTLLLNDFWIDAVHPSRLSTKWGQTIREFPPSLQNKIIDIFLANGEKPNFDDRITLNTFKKMRESVIEDLERMGVLVIRGVIKKVSKKEEIILVKTQFGERKISTKNKKIFNTLMTPRSLRSAYLYEYPPQTDLYKKPQGDEPEKLILIGYGLSALWAREQCPISDIKCIVPKNFEFPKKIIRNVGLTIEEKDIFYENNISLIQTKNLVNPNGYWISRLQDREKFIISLPSPLPENHATVVDRQSILPEKNIDILASGLVYNAAGFQFNRKRIPGVTNIYLSPKKSKNFSPKNLPNGAMMDRYTLQMSFWSSIFNVQEKEKSLLIPLEVLFFRPEHLSWLSNFMKNFGIKLTTIFFDNLRKKVSALEDTPERPLDVIKSSFSETHPGNSELHEKFSMGIEDLFARRRNLFFVPAGIKNKQDDGLKIGAQENLIAITESNRDEVIKPIEEILSSSPLRPLQKFSPADPIKNGNNKKFHTSTSAFFQEFSRSTSSIVREKVRIVRQEPLNIPEFCRSSGVVPGLFNKITIAKALQRMTRFIPK